MIKLPLFLLNSANPLTPKPPHHNPAIATSKYPPPNRRNPRLGRVALCGLQGTVPTQIQGSQNALPSLLARVVKQARAKPKWGWGSNCSWGRGDGGIDDLEVTKRWVCGLCHGFVIFLSTLTDLPWVCVLWWLYGIWTSIASIFLSTLSLWFCVLRFMVFCDVGLVDRRCWWSNPVFFWWLGVWFGGFYMDFMSTTAGKLADEAERRWGMLEREKARKIENIILMREEREV